MRPHLGQIEGVDAVGRGIRLGHQLHLQCPRRVVAPLDRIVEILLVVSSVVAGDRGRLRFGEAVDALVGLEMELHPVALTGGVHPLEGVRPVAVHMPPAGRQAPVAEQPYELVGGLGCVGEEVPHVVRFLAVRMGVVLLGVDEVWELQRIPDEEDRRVVPCNIPVALCRVELHREPPRIPHCVSGTPGSRNRGEADEHVGLLAWLRHHVHARVTADVAVGDGEGAIGP